MADRITERRRYAKTAAKFARIETLREQGEHKTIRKASDTWTKRERRNPGDLHKPQDPKPYKDAGCVPTQPTGLQRKGAPVRVKGAACTRT